MYPFTYSNKGGILMLYKGKEYDENGILELLTNKDNDILTYKQTLC